MKKKTINLGKLSLSKETLANMDQLQGGAWPNTSGIGGYSPSCPFNCNTSGPTGNQPSCNGVPCTTFSLRC